MKTLIIKWAKKLAVWAMAITLGVIAFNWVVNAIVEWHTAEFITPLLK